jgi:hypothetical protein
MAKVRGRATPPGKGRGTRASGAETRKATSKARPPKPTRARENVEKQALGDARRKRRRPIEDRSSGSSSEQSSGEGPGNSSVAPNSTQPSAVPEPVTLRRAPSVPPGAKDQDDLPARHVAAPMRAGEPTPKRLVAPMQVGAGEPTPKRLVAPMRVGVGEPTPKRLVAPMRVGVGEPTPKRVAPPPPVASAATTPKRVAPVELVPPAGKSEERLPPTSGRIMELHWGDSPPPPSSRAFGLVQRWMKRGDALLRHLAEHGAARHEYRADLREGRFVWISPEGRVSAEAQAQVICSYAKTTSVIAMGWADPLLRSVAIARLDGMPSERDNIDEEAAWRVAMRAAELSRAEYLYRVTTPHAWYFLALHHLTFNPKRASFSPGTPVGMVIRNLRETRQAIESRAEPSEIVRARLSGVGQALLQEASYAYRDTDWVARLERTGRRLLHLAERLPRESFHSVAAGRYVEEWLDREATVELIQSLMLLEDEWALFT